MSDVVPNRSHNRKISTLSSAICCTSDEGTEVKFAQYVRSHLSPVAGQVEDGGDAVGAGLHLVLALGEVLRERENIGLGPYRQLVLLPM
jgi:hypothetical protein